MKESVLDIDISDTSVTADELIEFEIDDKELAGEFTDLREVYYPYYRSGETVFDPVLGEEI